MTHKLSSLSQSMGAAVTLTHIFTWARCLTAGNFKGFPPLFICTGNRTQWCCIFDNSHERDWEKFFINHLSIFPLTTISLLGWRESCSQLPLLQTIMPNLHFTPQPRGCVWWLAGSASRVTLLWAARNAEPGQTVSP